MAKYAGFTRTYISQTLDDLRPCKVDWQEYSEYVPGHTLAHYDVVCYNCWNLRWNGNTNIESDNYGDKYLYQMMGIYVPPISWEDPLGKITPKTNDDKIKHNTSNLNIAVVDDDIEVLTKSKRRINAEVKKADNEKWKRKQRNFEEKVKREQKEYENSIKMEKEQKKG